VKKRERTVSTFLLHLSKHYAAKAQRVRARKGIEHLHTRRLERIAKHLGAAYDGIVGDHDAEGNA
jgi:hypothetical protein